MKKLSFIVLFMLIFSFMGCTNSNDLKQNDGGNMKEICITNITHCNIEWEQVEFSIELGNLACLQEKRISSEQEAKNIAIEIINEIRECGKFYDYVLLSIVHYTSDNIWIFEYSVDQRNQKDDDLIDFGGLYVAVDGNNGALIKSWHE